MSLHLSSACFPAFSRSKFPPARAVEGGVDVKVAEVEKKSLGGSELKVSKLGIGAWSWGDTSYWNSFDWDGNRSLLLVLAIYLIIHLLLVSCFWINI